MYKFISVFLTTTLLISCASEDSLIPCNGNGLNNISTEFYGKWQSIYTGQETQIDNCIQITIDEESSTATQLKVTSFQTTSTSDPFSDTWIRHTPVLSTVKINVTSPFRNSIQNYSRCPGETLGSCGSGIDLSGLNTDEEVSVSSDSINQEQTITDVPPGEYNLTATITDQTNTAIYELQEEITINDIETQLGTYNLVADNENNFKIEIQTDKQFVYGDYEQYEGTLTIVNNGNSDSTITSVSIDNTHPSINSASFNQSTGYYPVNHSTSSPFTISFKYLDTTYTDIPINIEITDSNQDIWNSTSYIRVYKNKTLIRATSRNSQNNSNASNGRIHGYLVTDNLKYTPVYGSNETLSLPYIPGQNHHFILASNHLERQLNYSIGINTEPSTHNQLDPALFEPSDPILLFEPNDTIDNSTDLILGEVITSTLTTNDVDSYSIFMPTDPQLHAAVSIVYADHLIHDGNYLDAIGDDDENLERGETAYISLGVENLGTSNSSNITIELSTLDQNVTIENLSGLFAEQDRTVQLNGLETRGTYHSNDYPKSHSSYLIPTQGFKISVNPALPPDQTEVTVNITATEADRDKTYSDTFIIPIL